MLKVEIAGKTRLSFKYAFAVMLTFFHSFIPFVLEAPTNAYTIPSLSQFMLAQLNTIITYIKPLFSSSCRRRRGMGKRGYHSS